MKERRSKPKYCSEKSVFDRIDIYMKRKSMDVKTTSIRMDSDMLNNIEYIKERMFEEFGMKFSTTGVLKNAVEMKKRDLEVAKNARS